MTGVLVPTSPPIGIMSPLVGLLPPELAGLEKDCFFWEFDQLPVGAAGSATATVPITQQNSTEKHLLLMGGMAQVTDDPADTALIAFYPALVTLIDGTRREMMNNPAPFSSMFGTAGLPAIWPWRKFVAAGQQFTVKVQSLDAAARRVRITLLAIAAYTGS